MMSNSPAYTPEHKSAYNCNYTHTLTPKLTAPAACTKLQNTISEHWNRKNHGSTTSPKVWKHGVAVFRPKGGAGRTQRGGGAGRKNEAKTDINCFFLLCSLDPRRGGEGTYWECSSQTVT